MGQASASPLRPFTDWGRKGAVAAVGAAAHTMGLAECTAIGLPDTQAGFAAPPGRWWLASKPGVLAGPSYQPADVGHSGVPQDPRC